MENFKFEKYQTSTIGTYYLVQYRNPYTEYTDLGNQTKFKVSAYIPSGDTVEPENPNNYEELVVEKLHYNAGEEGMSVVILQPDKYKNVVITIDAENIKQ